MEQWIHIATAKKATALSEDDLYPVTLEDGTELVICRYEGVWYALANECSHEKTPLSQGEVYEGAIECPRHGARFDLRSGKNLSLPATRPIATYPVIENEEGLFIKWITL